MLAVHPLPTSATAISNAVSTLVAAPAKYRASKDEIRLLVPEQPLYRPADAARLCGISEDSVTRFLALRPTLFPPKVWARRHEWSREAFVDVVWTLSSLSCRASSGLEKNLREKCG